VPQGLQTILLPRMMEQYLAGGAQAGRAVDRSIAPANLDTNIVQPTDPIVRYCFILSIDSSNNKTYKCKQCGKIFKALGEYRFRQSQYRLRQSQIIVLPKYLSSDLID
jgi:hypothetical protein